MAFEDIAARLAQVGAGWTIGTMEREKADREEAQRLTTQAVQLGAQGIDIAPFFQPEHVRPANAPLLGDLQSQSSGGGALQYPYERNLAVTAQREQTRYDVQSELLDTRLDAQYDIAGQRIAARAARPLRSLSMADWTRLRTGITQEIGPDIASMLPDVFTTDNQGRQIVANQQDQVTLGQIRRAIERRLPADLPNDPVAVQQVIRRIWEEQVRPNVVAQPSSWNPLNFRSRAFTYNESEAVPQRSGTGSAISLDQPGGITPTGVPVGQAPRIGTRQPGQDEAGRSGQLLAQYNRPIMQAATEFNLPPLLVAAQIEAESRGRPDAQGPVLRDGERAHGLMQVRPSTYNQVAGRVSERRGITNPDANIRVGSAYLREMIDRYHGHTGLALAAYNWGPRHVDNLVSRMSSQPNVTWQDILQRMPLETRNYIQRISNTVGDLSSGTVSAPSPNVQVADASGGPVHPPRSVPQLTPTPQDSSVMENYIQQVAALVQRRVQSVTRVADRIPERTRAFEAAMRNAERYYPQYRDWVRAELERRIRGFR